jgi:2-polyprenyl-6-hydroxyphenyl methylase/3-demethylubiquinone-9 3-methyltransferase
LTGHENQNGTIAVNAGVEIQQGERFPFGRNWSAFLRNVDEPVIERAQQSLLEFLELDDLHGSSFVDAGSGSGLFSLSARRLGARVCSFDFDAESVACTRALKARFFPDDGDWRIEQLSVLDDELPKKLGRFDVVYCWGVAHHTGQMWNALDNVARLLEEGGLLYVAVYNDQGRTSRRWKQIKKLYNVLPRWLRFLVLAPAQLRIWGPTTIRDLLHARPFRTWLDYPRQNRGMSPWTDLVDWVGGYPFEVARPEEVLEFFRKRGLQLQRLRTCGGGRGCNEYVFRSQPGA